MLHIGLFFTTYLHTIFELSINDSTIFWLQFHNLHFYRVCCHFRFQVVDMFGCGLPVAAKSCPALHELVINGINGMIFDSSDELAKQVSNSINYCVKRNLNE
jgi:hypothetical protein